MTLSLAKDRSVNTTGFCVADQAKMFNHIESKGNTWVVSLARIIMCRNGTDTNTNFVAVCICREPSQDLAKLAASQQVLQTTIDIRSMCFDGAGKACLNSWKTSAESALHWEAGPNGKYSNGETITIQSSNFVLSTSENRPLEAVIWAGKNASLDRLKDLNTLVVLTCTVAAFTILWFGTKVLQHYREGDSVSRMYGIS